MDIKAILAKIAKGEALTDAEKAFVKEFDPQTAIDTAAANARRKAEDKQKELETAKTEAEKRAIEAQQALDAKNNEGKPELEKLKTENERLKEQLQERDKTIVDLSQDKETLTRQGELDRLFQAAGIAYVDKVDAKAQSGLFKGAFSELSIDDLADETITGPIVEKYRTSNEAIIADKSGHGSGGDPTGKIMFNKSAISNPFAKETFNLTLQGQIRTQDPELATRLESEAKAA